MCVCVCVYRILIQSSVDGHLGCFRVLAIVNSAALNTKVRVSFQIGVVVFCGYIPRSGIAGSYGSSIVSFLFFVFFSLHIIYLFIYLFILINLFLAVLGLRFCARAFSSCGKQGPLFIAVRGPLTTAASPVAEHRLQVRRLSSCGSRAQLLRSTRDPPRPGLEPVSPALAGRLSTTVPPGKPPL